MVSPFDHGAAFLPSGAFGAAFFASPLRAPSSRRLRGRGLPALLRRLDPLLLGRRRGLRVLLRLGLGLLELGLRAQPPRLRLFEERAGALGLRGGVGGGLRGGERRLLGGGGALRSRAVSAHFEGQAVEHARVRVVPDMRAPWARSSDVFALSTAAATTLAVPASRRPRSDFLEQLLCRGAALRAGPGARGVHQLAAVRARLRVGSSAGEATASAIARREIGHAPGCGSKPVRRCRWTRRGPSRQNPISEASAIQAAPRDREALLFERASRADDHRQLLCLLARARSSLRRRLERRGCRRERRLLRLLEARLAEARAAAQALGEPGHRGGEPQARRGPARTRARSIAAP